MTDRINQLILQMKQRDLVEPCVEVKYDNLDLGLPEPVMIAKRIIEYITAQPIYLSTNNRFTGMVKFIKVGDVPADIFHRSGHMNLQKMASSFIGNYIDNLVTSEWQHSSPDYETIIKKGIISKLNDIAYYKEVYKFDKEKYDFLCGMEIICNGVIKWASMCAKRYREEAENTSDNVRKNELLSLAKALENVPYKPCETFYEGLVCLILCFQFLPDSIGTMDRYLFELYDNDIKNGVISRDEAKDLIQEAFVHICNHTAAHWSNADKSAECHFAIGGYTENGEDGFNDLSRLIVESIVEMDIRRPAISLRWTSKTPFEVLKFVLDAERNDPNKRIAFVNDNPRIAALTEIVGLPYSEAVKYTMVGCNEPSFPGTVWFGGISTNIVRSLTNTLFNRKEELYELNSFEDFYEIFKEELSKDIDEILYYADLFNEARAKDMNLLSCFMLDGCIENGKSATQYGCKNKIGGFTVMGSTCIIDSLTIIKQFVFDEKITTMRHLIETLESNWETDKDLKRLILKTGKFFGNDEEISNEMARRFTTELRNLTKNRRLKNGANILIGTLNGYQPHNVRFGELTKATPDGRNDGEAFMVGTGQARGKDRNGLLALMKSVSQFDPTHVMNGPVVCNMLIDEKLIKNDTYFDSVCRMIEQYFKMGGLHVQLNYVSKEVLLSAQKTPEEYQSLKVRVSGYSAPFVNLNSGIQNEIINRTTKGVS